MTSGSPWMTRVQPVHVKIAIFWPEILILSAKTSSVPNTSAWPSVRVMETVLPQSTSTLSSWPCVCMSAEKRWGVERDGRRNDWEWGDIVRWCVMYLIKATYLIQSEALHIFIRHSIGVRLSDENQSAD